MATKLVSVPGIGTVRIMKRRDQRSLRVSIQGERVTITQPTWLPYAAGEQYLASKLEWITQHRQQPVLFSQGQRIGNHHRIHYVRGSYIASRVSEQAIRITIPPDLYIESEQVQAETKKAIIRALRSEAEQYLPIRTRQLSQKYGFTYSSVSVKLLKRRWGSCTSKGDIVFNLHLMELEDHQIDYVILHELTHTQHMNHSPAFWARMEEILPDARAIAKTLRHYAL